MSQINGTGIVTPEPLGRSAKAPVGYEGQETWGMRMRYLKVVTILSVFNTYPSTKSVHASDKGVPSIRYLYPLI